MDYFHITLPEKDLHAISSLGLAHVGDAVYELMVRTRLAASGRETNQSLHRATVALVAATAQAKAAERILPLLTPEEAEVYKRGRNAHVHAVPQKATPGEYHAATGLETLFGCLYLKGRTERLCELFDAIMEEE